MRNPVAPVFWGIALMAFSHACGDEPFRLHHENVLGTSFELRVWAPSPEIAATAEETALTEIERMARIVSTYDPHSELLQWQAEGQPKKLSAELTGLLRSCDLWRVRTNGAFHPGVERISRLWKVAEANQLLPDEAMLAEAVGMLRDAPWEWSDSMVTPRSDYPVTFNAIAKGLIVDAACQAVKKIPGVQAVTVAVGGDLRCAGDVQQSVSIPSPRPERTGGAELDRIRVMNRAVATSSASYRGFTIQNKRYSHLIDPRTGQPVDHLLSATVVAKSAEEADVLATSCSVMSIEESLQLIQTLHDVECLLVDRDGVRHQSPGWLTLAQADGAKPQEKAAVAKEPGPWNGGFELKFDLEINQSNEGRRYRRPYVAAWVEDKDGVQVKTLLLWVQSTGRGPRWIPDLKRWYRSDRPRKAAEGTDLVELISEATRKPGEYSVIWKGTDNNDKLVAPGEYTVYIEAVREHGTYQIMQKKVTFGTKPFSEKLDGNAEIKAASIEYRRIPGKK